MQPTTRSVAIPVGGDQPPTEFRIFAAGRNTSTRGDVLFTGESVRTCSTYEGKRGVRKVIDLEHLSTDPTSPNYDPDARGHCDLEIRNGELWATNVTWTPDGLRRLSEKTQTYISPFFRIITTPDGEVVSHVFNIALVADPGLDHLDQLVAANAASASTAAQTKKKAGALTAVAAALSARF